MVTTGAFRRKALQPAQIKFLSCCSWEGFESAVSPNISWLHRYHTQTTLHRTLTKLIDCAEVKMNYENLKQTSKPYVNTDISTNHLEKECVMHEMEMLNVTIHCIQHFTFTSQHIPSDCRHGEVSQRFRSEMDWPMLWNIMSQRSQRLYEEKGLKREKCNWEKFGGAEREGHLPTGWR